MQRKNSEDEEFFEFPCSIFASFLSSFLLNVFIYQTKREDEKGKYSNIFFFFPIFFPPLAHVLLFSTLSSYCCSEDIKYFWLIKISEEGRSKSRTNCKFRRQSRVEKSICLIHRIPFLSPPS